MIVGEKNQTYLSGRMKERNQVDDFRSNGLDELSEDDGGQRQVSKESH